MVRALTACLLLLLALSAAATDVADRDWGEETTHPDPAFAAFLREWRGAVARGARDEVADRVAFPLPWGTLHCLDRRAFDEQFGAIFGPVDTAVGSPDLVVESRADPGRYFAWNVHYRDASEVLEQNFEFERIAGSYRLVRIGRRGTPCPSRGNS